MSRYVLKYTKEGYMRYISHLDTAQLFRRAFSRINVRLKHSEGFNPHPKLSFMQPLSLGYSSIGEYLELETLQPQDLEELKDKLNGTMPKGIAILGIRPEDGKKAISARIYSATYAVQIKGIDDFDTFKADMDKFLAQPEILRERKQKTGKMVTQDIRPMILAVNMAKLDEEVVILNVRVTASSNSTLNPEVFLKCFYAFSGRDYDPDLTRFCRTEMFLKPEGSETEIPVI